MDSFTRRLKFVELLLEGPKSRQWLLHELGKLEEDGKGLSPASLSSDYNALRILGFGFDPEAQPAKRSRQDYRLDVEFLPMWATEKDTRALRVATEVLKTLGLPEAEALEAMVRRVPERVRTLAGEVRIPRFAPSGDMCAVELFEAIQQGIASGRQMRLRYRGAGRSETKLYHLDRAELAWNEGALYLQAYCPQAPGRQKVERNREFRLDRLEGSLQDGTVELLNAPVVEAKIPEFELHLLVPPGFATRFKPRRGFLRMSQEPDGRTRLCFTERIVLTAVRRALAFGSQVQVVEPDFVVTQYSDIIRTMHEALSGSA